MVKKIDIYNDIATHPTSAPELFNKYTTTYVYIILKTLQKQGLIKRVSAGQNGKGDIYILSDAQRGVLHDR